MAESPSSSSSSSTSEKSPIDNSSLGFSIQDMVSSDPVMSGQGEWAKHSESSNGVEVVVEKNVDDTLEEEEEEKVIIAIERAIYKLSVEQAGIEAEDGSLAAVDDSEEGKDEETNEEGLGHAEEESLIGVNDEGMDVQTWKRVDLDDDINEKGSRSSEEENETKGVYEGTFEGHVGMEVSSKAGKHIYSNNKKRISYPRRPDAEDCAYYMKFGSCKFELNCKFNHPPRRKNQGTKDKLNHRGENSERAGQTECKYYLTSGGCKFGMDCKYTHNLDKNSVSRAHELNFLGLPIRLGEKECPYYLRTGSCKYGSNCRFHHPEPTNVGGDTSPGYGNGGSLPTQLVSSSSVSSWSSPRPYNVTSPFPPVIFHPNHGARTQNPEWNGYQAAVCPNSERSLPTPPAFAINNLSTEINFPMPHQANMFEEYPDRPGEPECSFFLKTGDCKFRSNCKFHHPKGRIPKPKVNSYSLGLPLRPDQPICTHYHRYGICKYGPVCKYDHPPNNSIMLPSFDQPR